MRRSDVFQASRVLTFLLLCSGTATAASAAPVEGGPPPDALYPEVSDDPNRDDILKPRVDKDKGQKAGLLGFDSISEAGPVAIGLGGGVAQARVAGTGVAALMAGRIEVFWAELQLKPGPSKTGAVFLGNRHYGYRTGSAYYEGWYDQSLEFMGHSDRLLRIGTRNWYRGDNRPGAVLLHDFRVGADVQIDALHGTTDSTAEGHLAAYIGGCYGFEVKAGQADNVPTHYGGIDIGVLFGGALGDVMSLRGWVGVEARGTGSDESADGIDDTSVTYMEGALGLGALFVMGPIPTEIELLYYGRIDSSGEPETWGENFQFDVLLSISWRPSAI